MNIYPPTLPSPLLGIYSGSSDPIKLTSSPSVYRDIFDFYPINVQFILKEEELIIFMDWYNNIIQQLGIFEADWSVPDSTDIYSEVLPRKYQFITTMTSSKISNVLWNISANVILKDRTRKYA